MVSFKVGPGFITIEAKYDKLTRVSFQNTKEQRENEFIREVKKDIQSYLKGEKVAFDYPLDFSSLNPSQIRVFKLLQKIPYGKTISYEELAKKASASLKTRMSPRAIGRILASNPFPIIIPCHRVINTSGALGGFSGGLDWKKYLLKVEGVRTESVWS